MVPGIHRAESGHVRFIVLGGTHYFLDFNLSCEVPPDPGGGSTSRPAANRRQQRHRQMYTGTHVHADIHLQECRPPRCVVVASNACWSSNPAMVINYLFSKMKRNQPAESA